jgi:(S)-2-hydroxy-acid oxidase
VDRMLDILHEEFKRCMQLMGCNSVQEITKACLGRKGADGAYSKL